MNPIGFSRRRRPGSSEPRRIYPAKEKFKVQTAENGKQALEILDGMVPDVITLDLMLPDIHGLECCKKLRADPRFQSVSILMLTALGQPRRYRPGL